MSSYGEVLAVLDAYRADLYTEMADELDSSGSGQPLAAFAARGAASAFAGPLTNVHATGVGLRSRNGVTVPTEHVIKVYVFDKQSLGAATPSITSKRYRGVDVDVEALPIQRALVQTAPVIAPAAVIPNRARYRPIVGGVSVAPMNAPYVGTLGGFVRRRVAGIERLFALSNNHVFADTNQLPLGTEIVQPGPETGPTPPADRFARLFSFIPIRFAQPGQPRPTNYFDAALAQVTDEGLIKRGAMLNLPNYSPTLVAPVPGMQVAKSGRTTGVTRGTVVATHVNGVQIDYGDPGNPLIAVFNDTVQVRSAQGSFSLPGDSGSVILDDATGGGTALLFAGDATNTFACNLAGVCRRFRVTLA